LADSSEFSLALQRTKYPEIWFRCFRNLYLIHYFTISVISFSLSRVFRQIYPIKLTQRHFIAYLPKGAQLWQPESVLN